MRRDGGIQKFEDLIVWQKAHDLVLKIYTITKDFPAEEKFCLASQMRRAAVSIVEGFRKRSKKDKINFYNIAQSSSDELRYYFILAKDLNYLKNGIIKEIYLQVDEVGKMLNGLIESVKLRL